MLILPTSTCANFPVYVNATGLFNINANGTDIRFTLADEITEIPREIEKYAAGTLAAWIKLALTKDAEDGVEVNDYKVYRIEDNKKQWLNITVEEFLNSGYSWEEVFVVNERERDFYEML